MSHSGVGVRQKVMDMELNDFETERARLQTVATRILGPHNQEVDDVVQEALLRFDAAVGVEDTPAWLTTVTTRLCLDKLRRRDTRSRIESSAPVEHHATDPESELLLVEQIGTAMEVVLETLTPAERAAFVLHDLFEYSFEEVGMFLGRSTTAVRQLASRARRKLQSRAELDSETTERVQHRTAVDAFLGAARSGDMSNLMAMLAPHAVMQSDAAAVQLGSEPIYDGAHAVATRLNGARGAVPVMIDGELGAAWIAAGEVKVVFVFHVTQGVIQEVELLAEPTVISTLDIQRIRTSTTQSGEDKL
jgi:RNA polymerase sigma factor (sigma-70 family)